MIGSDVLEILRALRAGGIDAWVHGGWGVDALVGPPVRPHEALHLVVRLEDLERARTALALLGFALTEDALPVCCTFTDVPQRRVTLHPVGHDADARVMQPQPDGGVLCYPPDAFTHGRIEGQEVPCVSAEAQMLCHGATPPRETARDDVERLHERLGVPLPEAWRAAVSAGARRRPGSARSPR